MRGPLFQGAGEAPGCGPWLALVGLRAAGGPWDGDSPALWGKGLSSGGDSSEPTASDPQSWQPSEAPALIRPALPTSPRLGPGVLVLGVACLPSSPAQGSSSKAWHCLSFLQNSHNNNINNNILDVVGLGRCPGVRVGQAAAYEGQGRVLAPAWARCCRSRGCGGGAPGRAECSTRFLMQPVMPEEKRPPVSVVTSRAPPI